MTDVERVRLAIGDRVAPYHYTDDEILELISQGGGDWRWAAAECCFIWARELVRQPSFTLGSFSESGAQEMAKTLNEKGKELLAQSQASHAGLYAGGISKTDVAASEADTDRVQPYFTTDMQTNPAASDELSTDEAL